MKPITIYIEKPNIRQRLIMITANFLLWLISKLFNDDFDKYKEESKEVIIEARRAIIKSA